MKGSLFTCVFICLAAQALAQVAAPTNLTAVWLNESGVRKVNLAWQNNASGVASGWDVQRKVGAGAWYNQTDAGSLTGADSNYKDGNVTQTSSTLTYYYYRVRAKSGSSTSGWAEVATAGIPSTWPVDNYDSDADGVIDSIEQTLGLNSADWLDGSGDLDGDLIPNAWESGLGTPINTPNSLVPHVTVDASYTGVDTSTMTSTINAAITKLSGALASNPPFRIILVKPGVYKEDINHTKDVQIALIADRSGANPKKECVIQGVSNNPVISTDGSLVVDGFVISRSPSTSGPAVMITQPTSPTTRIYLSRMNNCIVRNMNVATEAVVKQSRGRLVLAHCTFFMNPCDDGSLAHSYATGPLTGTSPLESTSSIKVWNCVFWNPINTRVPEFQSVGTWSLTNTICYAQVLPGTAQVNPGLTPKGYLMNLSSPANTGGAIGARVLLDMHGEVRYDPPGRGADEWNDFDGDNIPDFADVAPASVANAGDDLDEDLLTELGEYQAGTHLESADSQFLTLEQALRLFSDLPANLLGGFLTRTEADTLYMRKNAVPLQKLRVAPGGDIDMGIFQ
jgi:hypothetical protein